MSKAGMIGGLMLGTFAYVAIQKALRRGPNKERLAVLGNTLYGPLELSSVTWGDLLWIPEAQAVGLSNLPSRPTGQRVKATTEAAVGWLNLYGMRAQVRPSGGYVSPAAQGQIPVCPCGRHDDGAVDLVVPSVPEDRVFRCLRKQGSLSVVLGAGYVHVTGLSVHPSARVLVDSHLIEANR